MDLDLKTIKSVHFIGIGGIGISAIARMMIMEGKRVSGSDRSSSIITEELEKAGAKISIGHKAENISADCDLVIYSVAVPKDISELVEVSKRGIPFLTYPEALGIISKDKFTIAVSGTSGKTTTTAMIAKIMMDAGLDPTVIVGSLLLEFRSNFIAGKSKYLIVEADEYRRAFHNLWPSILVINNITPDHLDYFKDLADIQEAFNLLAKRVPVAGFVVCDKNDPGVAPALTDIECNIIDLVKVGRGDLSLQVPGVHNRHNAGMAFAVGRILGISDEVISKSLENFPGTWRRFEYKGKTKDGALVYDDYAHNPEKVRAALSGAREHFGPDKKIVAIFQPHLYSRTKTLLKEFSRSFDQIDELIILPIYAAREEHDPSISSEHLAKSIEVGGGGFLEEIIVAKGHEEAISLIPKNIDIIITVGAGDVTSISDRLTM